METMFSSEYCYMGSEKETSTSQEFDGGHLALIVEVETLEKLYNAIRKRDGYQRPVTPTIFTNILQQDTLVEKGMAKQLFDKIDWASLNGVTWREFCSFMSGEFKILESREAQERVVQFNLPAPLTILPHRDHTIKVINTADGLWITISLEATIALWDNSARLKRYKSCLSKQRMRKKLERKWITDAALMIEFSKVILATGDREIQFYDMASFAPFCQISGFESIPVCIHYKTLSRDKCLLIYGDQMGCVGVLSFICPWKSFRLWKKLHKHEDFIPSIPIEQAILENHISFMRWQVHRDWVSMVQYCQQTDQIVSCSKDPEASLVIGNRRGSTNITRLRKEGDPRLRKPVMCLYSCTRSRLPHDQIVYCLTRGITTFDYSVEMKMVATGGADRTIRLWNCYLNKKPVAILPGHYDIIKYLQLYPPKHRLFSASADRWIKIWDVLEHICLLTLSWHEHLVTGDLRAFKFSSNSNSVAVVGDNNIAILKIKTDEDVVINRSHKNAVKCILYNPHFNQIISACSQSTIKVWTLDTGHMQLVFHNAHGEAGIADMTLDTTGKRLITVATDGTAKMWNYNTGVYVRSLQPGRDSLELSSVTYVDMRNIKHIVTGGLSRRLNMYVDDIPETIPFVVPLLNHWRDDLLKGHQADILCCEFSLRDRVATGDSSGQVFVWNMETCTRANVLNPPKPTDWSEEKLMDDKGVSCLHFLKLRSKQRRGGNLVVGGPYGQVCIWNVNFSRDASAPLACFSVSEENTDNEVVSVSALASDLDDTRLVTADSKGFLTIWALNQYALDHSEDYPPNRLVRWMGHTQRVTGVKMVTTRQLVVSCSMDHTVRLWNRDGHYIGTFGQREVWDVDVPTTYNHPKVPKDISEMYEENVEVDMQQDNEPSVENIDQVPVRRRDCDPFETGLNYFARKKGCLSKQGRHLNDEDFKLYSSMGEVVPYQSLRHHSLQASPVLQEGVKARINARHAPLMEVSSANS